MDFLGWKNCYCTDEDDQPWKRQKIPHTPVCGDMEDQEACNAPDSAPHLASQFQLPEGSPSDRSLFDNDKSDDDNPSSRADDRQAQDTAQG